MAGAGLEKGWVARGEQEWRCSCEWVIERLGRAGIWFNVMGRGRRRAGEAGSRGGAR